jgi:integrase
VNRKLSALASFCEFHTRHGVDLGGLLVTMRPAGRRGGASWKPFLHHVTKHLPQRRRAIKLKAPKALPEVLTARQVQAILDACEHLRDRLLFAVLLDTGVRIGEALGLRHEDLAVAERELTVTPRRNDNRARAKAGISRTIPTSAELMRLYADYLTGEYGALDSDYVFVNLWGRPHGHPLAYPAVYDLVKRLRRRTGIDFGPHRFRHTYATWLLRRGAGMESVGEREGTAGARLDHDHDRHLRPPDRRGRPQDPGDRGLVHRPGGAAVTTAQPTSPSAVGAGLLERLMAAVRPEFRVELLRPDQDDPVLGWKACAVGGCDRPGHDYELCRGHGLRWRKQGRPDRAVFLADPGPPLRGRAELTGCTVPGCRYGTSGRGLCSRHRDKWERAGRPDPTGWAATAPPLDPASSPAPSAGCRFARCGWRATRACARRTTPDGAAPAALPSRASSPTASITARR